MIWETLQYSRSDKVYISFLALQRYKLMSSNDNVGVPDAGLILTDKRRYRAIIGYQGHSYDNALAIKWLYMDESP